MATDVKDAENKSKPMFRTILYGSKKLVGVVTRADATAIRAEFRKGMRLRIP